MDGNLTVPTTPGAGKKNQLQRARNERATNIPAKKARTEQIIICHSDTIKISSDTD